LPPARNAADTAMTDTAMTDTAMTDEFGKDWTKVNGTGPGVLPTAYCWPCEPNSLIACRSTANNSPRASRPKITVSACLTLGAEVRPDGQQQSGQ
jgi:hypothetical protein